MFDKILIQLSEDKSDVFTIDDALKGVSIIGGTGSGKTTGSGKMLAKKYLEQGWGGLVLCAKYDEADLWRQYCKDTNREKDLIVFSNRSIYEQGHELAGQSIVFNPIDYEMKREGQGAGETFNITTIFMNIYKIGNRIAGENDVKEERYWDTALKRCLNRVIELIKLAKEDLTYKNMVQVLTTSHNVDEETYNVELEYAREEKDFSRIEAPENYCLKCLVMAHFKNFAEGMEPRQEINDANNLVDSYFLIELPKMDERTKSIVFESFMGIAEPFLSGLLYRHFSGVTNLKPEWTYTDNKIIVLDFPIKEYLEAGIIAQVVFKYMFQQAIERRNISEYENPVFIWADEAQYFVNPYDQVFLTTARSSRTATVFLSQNISNYFAVIGSGGEGKARVDSLMGNLSTKIFHANSDAETNKYASLLIGESIATLATQNKTQSIIDLSFSQGSSMTEHNMPQIQPREFTVFKSGGVNNNYIVEAVVFITGKLWSNGTNFIRTSFTQNFKSKP